MTTKEHIENRVNDIIYKRKEGIFPEEEIKEFCDQNSANVEDFEKVVRLSAEKIIKKQCFRDLKEGVIKDQGKSNLLEVDFAIQYSADELSWEIGISLEEFEETQKFLKEVEEEIKMEEFVEEVLERVKGLDLNIFE